MSRLDGKTCVVTGAAGGIGSAIAEKLGAEGGNVAVADLDGDKASAVAEGIRSNGGRAIPVVVDVTDRDSVQAGISRVVGEFGQLDVIFNNAGISKAQRFIDLTEDEYERLWRVNSLGVLICMQEAIKQMIDQGHGGKVINTASIGGKQGFGLFAAYCATKFSVVAWTQSAAQEVGGHGITVNAFCPGIVTTPLWDGLDDNMIAMGEAEKPGETLESFADGIALGRLSAPSDLVGLTTFLASADSDYLTGQSIVVDGGMLFS